MQLHHLVKLGLSLGVLGSIELAAAFTSPAHAQWWQRSNAAPTSASKILSPAPVRTAQLFRTTVTLPAGQTLVTRLDSNQALYISNGQSVPAKLRVENDVYGNNGTVLIPAGATVEGEFVPANGGSKFVARTLTSRGATVTIGAESNIINDTKDPRETGTGAIIGDAAIGAAGAAILASITGDRAIATEEILGGAAAGVIVGNTTAPNATVIEPRSAINLVTNRSLSFTRRE